MGYIGTLITERRAVGKKMADLKTKSNDFNAR